MASLGASDVSQVLQYLSQALLPNPEVQRQAEGALLALENSPGFCSVLAEVVGSREADPSARWLAAVHLKNQITKQWRRRGLSSEEKSYLRQKLLALIDQEDNQVAVQVAVAVSRAARVDFPREWPSLFSDLLNKTAAGSTLVVRRVYFVLHHVLKELSSKRLVADQQTFSEVARTIFDHVWSCWSEDTQVILSSLAAAQAQPQQAQPTLLRFERWLLLLKIIRRLIMFGYTSDVSSMQPVSAVNACAPAMLQTLQLLLQAQSQWSQGKTQLAVMLERGLLKLLKTQSQILEAHPWSYFAANALFPAAECCCSQLTSRQAGQGQLSDQLLTQCCIFLVTMLQCPSYKGRASLVVNAKQSPAAKEGAQKVQAELKVFWDAKRVTCLAEALLHNHLPLLPRELEEWAASPEEWHHHHEGGAWKDGLRTSAEQLFYVLLEAHQQVLAPGLMRTLQSVSEQCPPGVAVTEPMSQVLLLKEALYSVAALCSYQLHDHLDYNGWLRSALLKDLHDSQPATRMIRRAACKVIAAWVPRLSPSDRPGVYQSLLLLMADKDMAVALSAASTLRALVDDFGFEESQFVEMLGPVLTCLTTMLHEASMLDSQTQVFSTINIIVERMGSSMAPFTSGILSLIPGLWRESEGQTLLRIQILESLQKVVGMLGLSSPESYSVVVPLLEYALDLNQSESLSLLEDGLMLWLVALRNAPSPEPALLHLFSRLLPIMAASTEHIASGMHIINSSILLGGREFLAQYGNMVAAIYGGFLGTVKDKGMVLVLGSMGNAILVGGADAATVLQPALLKLLHMLLQGKESTIVVSNALDVVARLVVAGVAAFQQLILAAAEAFRPGQPGATPDSILSSLLDIWTDGFDSIATLFSRKLSALAMCAMLSIQSGAILEHLQDLLVCVTSVWSEQESSSSRRATAESDYGSGGLGPAGMGFGEDDEQLLVHPGALESEDAEGEYQRRQQVQAGDVVLQLRIGSTLATQLQASSSLHGAAFDATVATIDTVIMQQVQTAIQQLGK